MATIRDVVRALSSRPGVDAAVIVLGRDGLPIDAMTSDSIDSDGVAALVPSVVAACSRLGGAAARGEFAAGVVEFSTGMILVSSVTADTLLAILVAPDTNVGALLFELERHRSAIAGLF